MAPSFPRSIKRVSIDFCIDMYSPSNLLTDQALTSSKFVTRLVRWFTSNAVSGRSITPRSLTFLVVHVPDVKFRQKQAGNVSLLRNYPIKSFCLESSWIEMELLSVISPLMMWFNSSYLLNSSIIKSRFYKYFGEYYLLFRNYYYSIKIIFLDCLLSY